MSGEDEDIMQWYLSQGFTADDDAIFKSDLNCEPHWGLRQLIAVQDRLAELTPSNEAIADHKAWLLKKCLRFISFRQRNFPSKYTETVSLLKFVYGQDPMKIKHPIGDNGRFRNSWFGMIRSHRWFDGRQLPLNARTDCLAYDLSCHIAAAEIDRIAEGRAERFHDPDLAKFAVDVLRGDASRPSSKGRYHMFTWVKRRSICEMVNVCVENGLPSYRNEATLIEESACDAVAEYLGQCGASPKTYDAVRKVWAQRASIEGELARAVGIES